MAMKLAGCAAIVATALGAAGVEAIKLSSDVASCDAQERSHRSKVLEKLAVLDVKCEEMCKSLGAYPDGCQCPGFAGNPSSEGDTRKCIDQYCQDPSTPCPNDGFVTCVDEATKISALQWSTVANKLDSSLSSFSQMFKKATQARKQQQNTEGCKAKEAQYQVLLQHKMELMDQQCEDMCRRLGEYPNCQCPGFDGNPSSSGDSRKCVVQYCQDPKAPCPNEAFATCVDETTKVSALQWGTFMEKLDHSLSSFARAARAARAAPAK